VPGGALADAQGRLLAERGTEEGQGQVNPMRIIYDETIFTDCAQLISWRNE
jgi:hypothetical protein